MAYGYIIFWNDEEKPLRITPKEHAEILRLWRTSKDFIIRGNILQKSDIRRVKPPEKEPLIQLPSAPEKPVTKEFLEKMKAKISKRFSS